MWPWWIRTRIRPLVNESEHRQIRTLSMQLPFLWLTAILCWLQLQPHLARPLYRYIDKFSNHRITPVSHSIQFRAMFHFDVTSFPKAANTSPKSMSFPMPLYSWQGRRHPMFFCLAMSKRPHCVSGGLWLKDNYGRKIINSRFFPWITPMCQTTISNKTALGWDITMIILILRFRILTKFKSDKSLTKVYSFWGS